MMIFDSYVSLPEGKSYLKNLKKSYCHAHCRWYAQTCHSSTVVRASIRQSPCWFVKPTACNRHFPDLEMTRNRDQSIIFRDTEYHSAGYIYIYIMHNVVYVYI